MRACNMALITIEQSLNPVVHNKSKYSHAISMYFWLNVSLRASSNSSHMSCDVFLGRIFVAMPKSPG